MRSGKHSGGGTLLALRSPTILALFLSAVLLSGCAVSGPAADLDPGDPQSVLREYFAAWNRGDFDSMRSLEERPSGLDPAPLNSIRVASITALGEPSSRERAYRVSLDVDSDGLVDCEPVPSGHHEWSYVLRWDKVRKSWLIAYEMVLPEQAPQP
jgi:hypothetical protein